MGYVAAQSLLWGDETIPPGDPVPADEPGRDYAGMLHLGLIRETGDDVGLSDDEVRKELAEARKRISELEDQSGEQPEGPRLVLSDEQRELLVGKGLDGEFTLEQLDEALSDSEEDEAATQAAKAAESASDDGSGEALPEGVVEQGGGWYLLPDGETRVRGRKALDEALASS